MLRVLLNGIAEWLLRVLWTLGSLLLMRGNTETHREMADGFSRGCMWGVFFFPFFFIIIIVCIYVCVVTMEEGDMVHMHHNTCADIRRNKFWSYLYLFPSLCGLHGSNLGHLLCPACTFTQWAISQGQLFSLFLWQKRRKNWQKLLMEGRILFTSLCKGTVHRDEKGMAKRVTEALVEVSEPVGQAVSTVWAWIDVNPGIYHQLLSQRDGVFQFRDGSSFLRQASLEILSQAHLEAYLLGDSKTKMIMKMSCQGQPD